MKTVKLFLIAGLFSIALMFASCNSHTPNDANGPISSEGIDTPSITNTKDSTAHNDTVVTPVDDNEMKKNNPDITK